ncbi:MAG: chemotaxis protein, partial [Sulfuricurvum sp.]|nr:chemotaxis protein [Sulfuricurvum sp.]
HLPSYKDIAQPHEIVHNEVHKNLHYIQEKDLSVQHKEDIIRNFESMEDASYKLFSLMDNLIRESEENLMRNS